MKNEIIDDIIDNIIMLNCAYLKQTGVINFFYKDNIIYIGASHTASTLIWINDECYTISTESHKKLMNYVKRKRSLSDLHMNMLREVRKVKLKNLEGRL